MKDTAHDDEIFYLKNKKKMFYLLKCIIYISLNNIYMKIKQHLQQPLGYSL